MSNINLPLSISEYLAQELGDTGFQIAQQRHQAFTILVPGSRWVFKFVLHRPDLVTALGVEVRCLIALEHLAFDAPRVELQGVISGFTFMRYTYIDGFIAKRAIRSREHGYKLGRTLRSLHDLRADLRTIDLHTWDSSRMLGPIFEHAHSGDYLPEEIIFSHQLSQRFEREGFNSFEMRFIHSDAHFNNVLFTDKSAVLIDWAEAGWGSKYFDLGVVLHSISTQDTNGAEVANGFIVGYFGEERMSDKEARTIEAFILLRYLEATTWQYHESEETQTEEREENMEYTRKCFGIAREFTLAKLLNE